MLDRRCTIFFGFLVSASLVSGEKAPEKIVVNQGQDVSMYCSTSNPFGFCEWKMQSKGVRFLAFHQKFSSCLFRFAFNFIRRPAISQWTVQIQEPVKMHLEPDGKQTAHIVESL